MAAEITASSMGESIGLGYRTKDIGPQLMQFQASVLARRSAEKSAAKKEKKAEYDKIMDKFFTIGTGKTHTSIQKEFNTANDQTKKEVETALMNDDRDTAMQLIYEAAKRSNDYADRTKNYDGIEEAYRSGSKIVPEDVVNSIKGDKFTKVDGNQTTFLNALGYQFDDKTQQYIAQGFDKKNTLEELRSVPKPTKEMFDQYQVTPNFSEEKALTGYYKKGTMVYVPTDKMFLDVVGQKVQDPSFVANEVNRIAQNNSKTYVQLATATQADMAEKNRLAGIDKPITAEEVNRQMVINDLTLNHKDQWIKEHTIGEDRNPIPVGGGSKAGGKEGWKPNPTSVSGTEHLSLAFGKAVRGIAEFKDYTDKQIIEITKKDPALLSPGEKAIKVKLDAFNKGRKEVIHTRYPSVQLAQTTDFLTLPGRKSVVTQKIDEIYYDKDNKKFFARLSTTGSQSGASAQVMDQQIPLSVEDLKHIRSAAVKDATVRTAIAELDGNAKAGKYETIDDYINRASGKITAKKKITKAQFDAAFAEERKKKPNVKAADYKKFLLDTGEYTFAF
jgi:hypothetical protein